MVIGAVIPYRMRASRLPGKPLLDVSGKPALVRVVERARACRPIGPIVIATTCEAEDDILCTVAAGEGLRVHRGSSDDVLGRLAGAAAEMDWVVEIDGDDLLCAPEYMELGLRSLQERQLDYVHFDGLPLGLSPSVLRGAALQEAARSKGDSDSSTGIFRYLWESGDFRCAKLATDAGHAVPGARLTLDYEADLQVFRAVYAKLDQQPGWGLMELLHLLRTRSDLLALNQGLDEVYWRHFAEGVRRGQRIS